MTYRPFCPRSIMMIVEDGGSHDLVAVCTYPCEQAGSTWVPFVVIPGLLVFVLHTLLGSNHLAREPGCPWRLSRAQYHPQEWSCGTHALMHIHGTRTHIRTGAARNVAWVQPGASQKVVCVTDWLATAPQDLTPLGSAPISSEHPCGCAHLCAANACPCLAMRGQELS